MITKTISGHYDSVFSLDHNNRAFFPRNVDIKRIKWNYNCVVAGNVGYLDLSYARNLAEFWKDYKALSEIYWKDRAIAETIAYEEYQACLNRMRRYRNVWCLLSDDDVPAFVTLLFLPLLIACDIQMNLERTRAKEEYLLFKEEQWLRDMEFCAEKISFREAVKMNDQVNGTKYLACMDSTVRDMAQHAEDFTSFAQVTWDESNPQPRFATLEEIYEKLYEPSFREFQNKQRPCRRYNGTYLESIREGRLKDPRNKQQSKNAKSRKTSEAVEIVFSIGDMDNTGYINALSDAKQSEILLKDFCDHLLEDPHMCFVTTKELEDPNWMPPFKNGLIILNLTVHCDEATPGVHLTCIPYSRGCKRGPAVQASLGKAMTGMGYPSTWKDTLDGNGDKIPKRTKSGEIVHNADGSVRYQQESDKQGIIDWIENQKAWIQQEMSKRYGWAREYKAARAKERKEALEKATREELNLYLERV